MIAVFGLGNPGKQYDRTPHNIGFAVIECIAEKWSSTEWKQSKRLGAYMTTSHSTAEAILVKPQTFMNLSGEAVRKIAAYYSIPVKDVWIIHDDFDIAEHFTKHAFGSRAAGHNGIQSIIDLLGTNEFHRIRIGIRPNATSPQMKAEDYVLRKLPQTQWETLVDEAVQKSMQIFSDLLAK